MAASCAALVRSPRAVTPAGSAERRAWSGSRGYGESAFPPAEPFGALLPRQPLSGSRAGRRRAAGTGRDRTGQNAAQLQTRLSQRPAAGAACHSRSLPAPGLGGTGLGSPGFRNRPRGGLSRPVPPRDLRRGAAPRPSPAATAPLPRPADGQIVLVALFGPTQLWAAVGRRLSGRPRGGAVGQRPGGHGHGHGHSGARGGRPGAAGLGRRWGRAALGAPGALPRGSRSPRGRWRGSSRRPRTRRPLRALWSRSQLSGGPAVSGPVLLRAAGPEGTISDGPLRRDFSFQAPSFFLTSFPRTTFVGILLERRFLTVS